MICSCTWKRKNPSLCCWHVHPFSESCFATKEHPLTMTKALAICERVDTFLSMGKEKSRSRNNSFQFCFFYVCKTQQEKANILHMHREAHHPFHGKSYLEYFQFLVSPQISWSLLLISIINLVSIWASHLCRLALLCPLWLKNHRVDIMEIENLSTK